MLQVPEPENVLSASTTCATIGSDNNIACGLQSPGVRHGKPPQLEEQLAQPSSNHLAALSAEACLRGDSDSQDRQPSSPSAHQLPLNIECNESFFTDIGLFLSDPGAAFAPSLQSPTFLPISSGLSLNAKECTVPTATSTLSTLTVLGGATAHPSSIVPNTSAGAAGQIDTGSPQTPSKTMMSPVATITKPARLTAPTASAITSPPTLTATSKRPPLPSSPSSPQTHQQQNMASSHIETNYTLETTYTMVYPSPPLQPIDPDSTIPSLQHPHKVASISCIERTDNEDDTPSSPSSPRTPQSQPTTSPSDPSPHNSPAQDGSAPIKMVSTPLQIHASPSYLKPVPQKSEDWAALIDTPDSPTESRHTMFVPPPMTSQFRRSHYGNEQLSESPAPEDGATFGPSSDYIRHVSPNLRPPQVHAQTDPTGMHSHANHRNYPYQNNQHHNSSPSVHLANHAEANRSYRKSWSASETPAPLSAEAGMHGYLTPPSMPGDLSRSRSSSYSKQGSVATSISLLTDSALVTKYRDAAMKTNDPSTQLSYAKYLLEIGEPAESYVPSDSHPPRSPSMSSNSSPSSSAPPSPTTRQQDAGMNKKQLTEEAIYWIDRLAKEGQAEAQFIKGTWYERGVYGSKRNVDKAIRWFQSSSRGDYGPAHYKYGYFCEKKKDNNKAVMLYKKAAIQNDVPANHRLAMVYLGGELGQSKNMKAGLQYLKRAASFADEFAPMSPYVLGLILAREYRQVSIPDDIAFPDNGEALEWFRKSAQLGYGPANYKLGYCYEYGSLGCPIDPFLSIQHYERAVRAENSNGEAEMALSGWYLSGADNFLPANDQLAFKYASMAAEKKLPKAQYAMGYYYEVGVSVPADMDKAMEYYKLAASNGNKDAAKRLEEKAAAHTKVGHKNSIRRMKQNRRSKDHKEQSCIIM